MKTVKKFACVIMAVLIIAPMRGGVLSALAVNKCDCPNAPYVYVVGLGNTYVTREDGTKYAPLDEDKYDVGAIAKELLPMLLEAFWTDEWTEYGTALYNVIEPNLREIKVNPDGTVAPNTGVYNPWSEDSISKSHGPSINNAKYYRPDGRLSPMDVADDINDYIEAVKRKTGHDKVNLIGRCMGGCYVMAYLQKYGYKSVNRLTLLTSTHNGAVHAEAIISGNMSFDTDNLIRTLTTCSKVTEAIDSDLLNYLIITYNMLRETHSDELCIKIVEKFYEKIKDPTFAPLLRDYYGAGGRIASVRDHFEEAIEYLYPTDELKEEYAVTIAKARDYHDNVMMKNDEILMELENNGVPVFTIVQYGFQQVPATKEESKKIGDNTVGADRASNGATVSNVNSTLSEKYVDSRIKAGYGEYISADKQIDASTALFPERTWFIKNIDHEYLDIVHDLMNYLSISPVAPTIKSNPDYPQFMTRIKDENGADRLVKLDENNCQNIDWDAIENSKGGTVKFFKTIVKLLKNLLNNFLDKILETVNKSKAQSV